MKFLSKSDMWPLLLIFLVLIFGMAQLARLPSQVPSHWNWKGEVDDYSSKTFVVFFFPLFTIAIYLVLSLIPLIDPLRENFERFPRVYYWIKFAIVIMMLAIYVGMLLTARGKAFNIVFLIQMLLGLLVIFLGSVMGKFAKTISLGFGFPGLWPMKKYGIERTN